MGAHPGVVKLIWNCGVSPENIEGLPGSKEAYPGVIGLKGGVIGLILEPWRLTVESGRLT
jgi:hypothetical protein